VIGGEQDTGLAKGWEVIAESQGKERECAPVLETLGEEHQKPRKKFLMSPFGLRYLCCKKLKRKRTEALQGVQVVRGRDKRKPKKPN